LLAGARPERGGDLARIGAKAKYSAVPARRARRLVLPIVLGAIVLVAVAILVRASFDTDEPAEDRLGAGAKARSPATGPLPGASQLGVGNPADQSTPPAAALAQPGSVTGVAPSPRAPAPSPASGSAASAAPPGDPAAAASPTGVARPPASPPPGGGPGAPGRAPAARAGAAGSKEPPRGGTAAAHAATSNTPGGAGGAGGAKAGDQKLALADSARREAVWQRPPSSEDSTSRLVARFSASGPDRPAVRENRSGSCPWPLHKAAGPGRTSRRVHCPDPQAG